MMKMVTIVDMENVAKSTDTDQRQGIRKDTTEKEWWGIYWGFWNNMKRGIFQVIGIQEEE